MTRSGTLWKGMMNSYRLAGLVLAVALIALTLASLAASVAQFFGWL